MKREGVVMVYALQKFRYCLLDTHFKFSIDHSMLKYLVNKTVLGGRICRWLLLSQEFKFEVVVKPCKHNVGPNHISRIYSMEVGGNLDDELPDVQLFSIEVMPNQLVHIATYFTIGKVLEEHTQAQHRQQVT
jgi:hypothetical protein